jgi:hypothetical protein
VPPSAGWQPGTSIAVDRPSNSGTQVPDASLTGAQLTWVRATVWSTRS